MADAFSDVIEEYRIIDCRYPYEFEGGHIQVIVYFFSLSYVLFYNIVAIFECS